MRGVYEAAVGTLPLADSPRPHEYGGEVDAKQTERGCWQETQWPIPPLRHELRPRHLSPNKNWR